MKSLAIAFVLFLFAAPCFGQYGYRADRYELGSRSSSYERYGERYSMNPPRLYSGGTYLGQLSSDRYAPDSVSNPYGRYGSKYSPDSVNNPYSQWGQYRTQPVWVYPSRW
jgi:hypothetical protein